VIRIAYVKPVNINAVGQVVDKNDPSTTTSSIMNSQTEMRVIPGPHSPNSHDFPTIEAYLIREDSDAFVLNHMDNNMIVTYSSGA
jgi:hypothetical protein